MPAQKRQRDSSTPPPSPSPSPPPDAQKSDDSQLGSENHIDEQPLNASGACLALSMCSRQRACIMFDTLNSSCIQHFCFRFLIVSFFVDLSRFSYLILRFRQQFLLQRRRKRRVMYPYLFLRVPLYMCAHNHV